MKIRNPRFPGAPFDRVLVVDFETAWDSKTYTLSKTTNEEYLRDPRFHAWGLCWKELDAPGKAVWVSHHDIPAWVASVDWSRTAVAAQNAQFDCSILAWIYGERPVFILDTLSMARALRGAEAGNSLAKLADVYGLPAKGRAVHTTDGMFGSLPPHIEQELADYCAHDVFLCEEIFNRLYEQGGPFPLKELRLIDMTIRMYVNPVLELDAAMLRRAIREEKVKRGRLLQRLDIDEKILASNIKFANVLQGLGVDPPMKRSKTTGKMALALAKSDAVFQSLLNGPREDISLLCEARLATKSTQARTRAQRFMDIAGRGPLPMPLLYYGAHTGRWSGTQQINLQNMKRGSFLRNAIGAPDGYSIVVGDLSQIEPRVLSWEAGDERLLSIFRSGVDVYASFGADLFDKPGMTKESEPVLRQSSKSALLGCGFQLGWASFSAQLLSGFQGAPPVLYDKTFAKQLGVTALQVERFLGWDENVAKMEAIPHTCTAQELAIHCIATKLLVDKYRATAYPVKNLWDLCQALIERSLLGGEEVPYKCLLFRKEEIVLPNGMSLRYPGVGVTLDAKGRKQFSYGAGINLYGGKITENITQALARIVMTDGMLRTQKRYFVAGTVHDEQIVLVPDEEAQEAVAWVHEQMVKPPVWMPDIPLQAEVEAGKRYGEVK